jgi:uncharacterized membrane protein
MAHPEDRLLSAVVVLLIALLIAVPVLMIIIMALGGFGSYGFNMMESLGNSWWIIVIPVFGLLAIALVLLLILGRPQGGPLPPLPYPAFPAKQEEPLAILDRRLASGEITIDEYLKLREHITRK